jgi:hypothetical protein
VDLMGPATEREQSIADSVAACQLVEYLAVE